MQPERLSLRIALSRKTKCRMAWAEGSKCRARACAGGETESTLVGTLASTLRSALSSRGEPPPLSTDVFGRRRPALDRQGGACPDQTHSVVPFGLPGAICSSRSHLRGAPSGTRIFSWERRHHQQLVC